MLAPLLLSNFFATVINVTYTHFKADKDIMDDLVHLRKERGRGEETVSKPVLETSLWDMLHTDDAGVISQSPERVRKMMEVIVSVCAAFCLTVLEAKIETTF